MLKLNYNFDFKWECEVMFSNTRYFQSLKLGRHTAITKALREGILKVGATRARKLENEADHDDWFSSIGDAPMAELLRLYSKVSFDNFT